MAWCAASGCAASSMQGTGGSAAAVCSALPGFGLMSALIWVHAQRLCQEAMSGAACIAGVAVDPGIHTCCSLQCRPWLP